MPHFVKNGPDIPFELLESHLKGDLVFFCGAGLSMYMGLPSFTDLVKKIYEMCIGGEMPRHLKKMCLRGKLDQVLHSIGRMAAPENPGRGDASMRRAAISILSNYNDTKSPDSHKALLTLSYDNIQKGHLLVTTNFDRLFHLAYSTTNQMNGACRKKLPEYSAPTMPVPHKGRWGRLTFLHGVIDGDSEDDPKGTHLVLSSADFGRAYLRDAWAARFVVELFRDFTVVFIGYSLQDPVMTYLVDAITTIDGEKVHFKTPYALVGVDGALSEEERNRWEDRGVIPIEYDSANHHKYLHLTLTTWESNHLRGVDGMAREALRIAEFPYQNDPDRLRHLLWLLKQPKVANQFIKSHKPKPDVSWLLALHTEEGLGSFPDIFGKRPVYDLRPIHGAENETEDDRKQREAEENLVWVFGKWITDNYESAQLCRLISKNSGKLSDSIKWHLLSDLSLKKEAEPVEPYNSFWNLLLSTDNKSNINGSFSRYRSHGDGQLQINSIPNLIRPCVKISSYYSFIERDAIERLGNLGRFEVVAVDNSIWDRIDLPESKQHKCLDDENLILLAFPLSETLAASQRLSNFVGDASLYMLSSIAPHKQNKYLDDVQKIALLCREAYRATRINEFEKANSLLSYWISLWESERLLIFGRLIIHALTEWPDSLDKLVELLCKNNGELLWSVGSYRETARFLRKRYSEIPPDAKKIIATQLYAGPPLDMYMNTEHATAEELCEDTKIQLLAKASEGGMELAPEYIQIINDYRARFTTKQINDRYDEFSSWSGDIEWVKEPTGDDWDDLSLEEIVEELRIALSPEASWSHRDKTTGKISGFTKRNPARGLDLLMEIIQANPPLTSDQFDPRATFTSRVLDSIYLVPEEDGLVRTIDKLLALQASYPESVESASLQFSRILMKSTECDLSNAKEEQFWKLWQMVWEQAERPSSLIEDFPTLSGAINSSGGELAEALVNMLNKQKKKAGEGFPEDYRTRFNLFLQDDGFRCRYGRIILARQLWFLHAIDPTWVIEKFRPFFEGDGPNTHELWLSFFSYPRISPNLWSDFKIQFLHVFKNAHTLRGEDFGRENTYQVFVDLLLHISYDLSPEDVREIISNAGEKGISQILWRMNWSLNQAQEKAATQWETGYKPVFETMWPEKHIPIPGKMAEDYCKVLIATKEMFPNALDCFKQRRLLPVSGLLEDDGVATAVWFNREDRNDDNYDIMAKHPVETLDMLYLCYNPNIHDLPNNIFGLKNVLDKLEENAPELREDIRFRSFRQKGY